MIKKRPKDGGSMFLHSVSTHLPLTFLSPSKVLVDGRFNELSMNWYNLSFQTLA
jgi:hypothetical protein